MTRKGFRTHAFLHCCLSAHFRKTLRQHSPIPLCHVFAIRDVTNCSAQKCLRHRQFVPASRAMLGALFSRTISIFRETVAAASGAFVRTTLSCIPKERSTPPTHQRPGKTATPRDLLFRQCIRVMTQGLTKVGIPEILLLSQKKSGGGLCFRKFIIPHPFPYPSALH